MYARQKAHRKTPEGKAQQKAQNASEQAREARHQYSLTPKGKAATGRAHAKFTAKIRRDARALLREAKDVPCVDCGGRFHFAAMDFDHVRGEKKGCLSTMASKTFSLETIREEMAKCDVVCANCHRVRTYEQKVARRRTANA